MPIDTWTRRAALQALLGNAAWLSACGGGGSAPASDYGSIERIADDVSLIWAPRITASSDGMLWLAWVEATPAGQQVVAARVLANGAVTRWPVGAGAEYAYAQQIVMAAGGPVIGWMEEAGGTRVRAAAWNGQRWVDEQDRAAAGTDSSYGDAQLSSGLDGRLALAWNEALDAGSSNLWLTQRAPGGGWTPPALVRTTPGVFPRGPTIAFDDAGDVMAVWQEYTAGAGSGLRLLWSICQGGGTAWSAPSPLDSGAMGEALVASPNAGVWVLVWQSIDTPDRASLQSRRFTGGAWSAARTNVAGHGSVGQFALDARAGIVQVAWTGSDPVSNQGAVRVARTELNGSEWTAPASLFTSSTVGAALPRVRLQADGRAAVTWGYFQGDRSPWIAPGASTNAWHAAQQLDDDPVWSSNAPDLVAVNDGWASAWYRYQDAGKLDVMLRRVR